jgi:pseudouridine-5'-phosphate glycosidase
MLFKYSSSYLQAKAKGIPIIAFESAIITHGLPSPENISLIEELTGIADNYNVYLALFWLDEGFVKIGFEHNELEKLAGVRDPIKVSCRDVPYVLTKGFTGGTTVAATIFLAHKEGLEVFATGGLGGVHYKAEISFDISNDLYMLAKTPIIVISAGIKAVLDVGRTVELLETLGIPLFGYQTNTLPLFYSRDSDFNIRQLETTKDIVSIYQRQREAGLTSSLIISNPIPEQWSIPKDEAELTIKEALREVEAKGISGQEVTPYLLNKLSHTGLGTVKTNLELVKNNVRLASEIALELHKTNSC